jgi:O-antigen/teichoic acid export membrane protein
MIGAGPEITRRKNRMTLFKSNLLANFAGAGWGTLVGLACTPIYIKLMGIEAYGLVGFYVMLAGISGILDFGLSPATSREMARYSVLPEKAGEARDFVRTLEIGYWATGILLGAIFFLGAPYISIHWFRNGDLPPGDIRSSVMFMGVLVALQRPLSLYQSGLMGLQRQVFLNGIMIATSTLGSVGALLALWFVAPTIRVYFIWQIIVCLLQVILTTIALWNYLPASGSPARVVPGLLRKVWRFAAGMSGITITALVLMQLDKIILSRLLPLKTFGYYILACAVSNGLTGLIITPVFNAIFPRFSFLVASRDQRGLSDLYHASTQVMAVLILPAAAVIALFSQEIMILWTRNTEIASQTAPIVSVLVIGTALNGLMNPPYALQLSHGWTRIGLVINTFFILTMVPTIFLAINWYGPVGAAFVWVLLNGIYMAFGVPITHRRLLKGEAVRWFTKDVGFPLFGAVLVPLLGRSLLHRPLQAIPTFTVIALVLMVSTAAAALASPAIRGWLAGYRAPSSSTNIPPPNG